MYFVSCLFFVSALVVLIPALISAKRSYLIAFGGLLGAGSAVLLVTCCLNDACVTSSNGEDVEQQDRSASAKKSKLVKHGSRNSVSPERPEDELNEQPISGIMRHYYNLPAVST